jgi:hypothetical protein
MSVERCCWGRGPLFAALGCFASADAYSGFDPTRLYTPMSVSPSTPCDRYLRFRISLKFFRTWERVRGRPPDTFQDLLLRMEKLGFISSATMWLTLRDLRNRIA